MRFNKIFNISKFALWVKLFWETRILRNEKLSKFQILKVTEKSIKIKIKIFKNFPKLTRKLEKD